MALTLLIQIFSLGSWFWIFLSFLFLNFTSLPRRKKHSFSRSQLWHEIKKMMFWAELCTPKVIHCNPNSHSDCIGDRAFKEVIKDKWGHKGGVLTQYNWCPYKKRQKHPRSTMPEQRKGHARIQQEGVHLQPKEWGFWQNQTHQHPDLELPALKTRRDTFLLCNPPILWYFIMADLQDLCRCQIFNINQMVPETSF